MNKAVLFDVIEADVFVNQKKVPSKKAILNADTKDVIGIVGKNYVPMLNVDVLDHCLRILKQSNIPYVLGEGSLIRGGSKTIIEISFPSMKIEADVNDVLQMKAYLINSFDGQSSAILKAGFIRLICKNGMTIGKTDLNISYKHIGDVNKKLVEGFRFYLEEKLKDSLEYIEELKGQEFKSIDQMKEIVVNCEWIAQKYQERLLQELYKAKVLTAWALYNVFTYVITHVLEHNMESKLRLFKKLNSETQNWGTM